MVKKKEIVLGVCGSIACFKIPDLITKFLKTGYGVSIIMTKEAEKFITPLTFGVISQNKVYRDMFEVPDIWDVEHISLAERAGLVLIAPATANVIAKIACGICDDLLTCIVSATKAKILIAPAMNTNMWQNKITQENTARLKRLGHKFVGPVKGRLACGDAGVGCLASIEDIVKEIKVLLK